LLVDAVPEAIADPGMTAIWEQALERIAAGELSLETFVEKQSAWVAKLVRSHANVPLRLRDCGHRSLEHSAEKSRHR
jgi:DNA topoisomerase-3